MTAPARGEMTLPTQPRFARHGLVPRRRGLGLCFFVSTEGPTRFTGREGDPHLICGFELAARLLLFSLCARNVLQGVAWPRVTRWAAREMHEAKGV